MFMRLLVDMNKEMGLFSPSSSESKLMWKFRTQTIS